MNKVPKDVLESIEEFKAQGFNLSQSKSLAWARRFDDYMNANSGKGNGFFGPEIRIDCYCKTCQKGANLLPDTARMFIMEHKGHQTKTMKVR